MKFYMKHFLSIPEKTELSFWNQSNSAKFRHYSSRNMDTLFHWSKSTLYPLSKAKNHQYLQTEHKPIPDCGGKSIRYRMV